jgi:hypothetical protein
LRRLSPHFQFDSARWLSPSFEEAKAIEAEVDELVAEWDFEGGTWFEEVVGALAELQAKNKSYYKLEFCKLTKDTFILDWYGSKFTP